MGVFKRRKKQNVGIIYGGSSKMGEGSTTHKTVKTTQKNDHWDMVSAQRDAMYNALGFDARAMVDSGGFGHNNFPMGDDSEFLAANDFDNDDEDFLFQPPPGDEGMITSHAGGEYFLHSLLSKKTRQDDRDRSDRVQKQVEAWKLQLPALAFRAHGPPEPSCRSSKTWSLHVLDFNTNKLLYFSHTNPNALSANESLARHGFIGGSPESPTIAFSFSLLDIYRQASHVLHNLHRVPYDQHREDQLRIAYDAYLSVLREVEQMSLVALKRESEKSFHTLTCPPCTYEVVGEHKLSPRMLIAIDGNASLKLVDPFHKSGNPRTDTRDLQHPRWIDSETVDEMKDEVSNAQKKPQDHGVRELSNPSTTEPSTPSNTDPQSNPASDANTESSKANTDPAWLNVLETDDLAACIDTCVERWRAAGPETQKKMYSFFSITGIFLAVCRYGHVLALCDMRKSGELMKYPLAIIRKLLEVYGEELGIGYDIMCAFYKTLLRSQKLGSDVIALQLRGVVPAFHGHAHNRPCQLEWHPMYIEGVGLEDFEECERTFSGSNDLAATTRLSTEFHRLQAMLEYFAFHDDDKHAASGNFIYQNYRQALECLNRDVPLFQEACINLSITPENCEQFLAAEREHFGKTFEDSPEAAQHIKYAEMLRRVWTA
ncbi:hypothetical protein V5O48_018820, partial [Marasmius crinis-equi]